MTTAVNIRYFDIIVNAPAEVVFDVISDLRNLPRWSIHYCRDVRLIGADACVTTGSGGKSFFGVIGDRENGVLDWWSGLDLESAERWPTRVVPLPDGRSLYHVLAIFTADVPPDFDRLFREELDALRALIESSVASAGETASVA